MYPGYRSGQRTLVVLAFATLLVVPGTLWGGGIADEFRDGVLGLKWGADIEEVIASFPRGTHWPVTLGSSRLTQRVYTVADDLPLFDVARSNQNTMFGFDRFNRLAFALFGFSYSEKAKLLERTQAAFGPPETSSRGGERVHYSWREDRGVSMWIIDIRNDLHPALFLVVDGTATP